MFYENGFSEEQNYNGTSGLLASNFAGLYYNEPYKTKNAGIYVSHDRVFTNTKSRRNRDKIEPNANVMHLKTPTIYETQNSMRVA